MEIVLIEGLSGSGKSYAWRNVPIEQSVIITPNEKSLSFGGTTKWQDTKVKLGEKEYSRILYTDDLHKLPSLIKLLAESGVKNILVEDFTHFMNTYLLSPEFQKQAVGNAAFERWKTFALKVFQVIKTTKEVKGNANAKDTIVVLHHHVEFNDKIGRQSFKIFGKMLSDAVDPVSFMTYVLHSIVVPEAKGNDRYRFLVNDDGLHEAKSPPGVFANVNESGTIPNDTWAVLQSIRRYNASGPLSS